MTKEKNMPLYLMDASAFIYKGYYGNMKMTRSDNFPTGAIYTVARVLLKLIKDVQPVYFSFVKDGKGSNFRHELFPLYKANRQSTPEELIRQLEPIEKMVKLMGLHLEISSNCEADDCIASLAYQNREERPVIIVGIDKDLKQCLHENVSMWDPSSKEQKRITLESFTTETGLKPEQWPDLQALIGDTSDNIPGIQGIGEKTALKIMADYPSLEEINAHINDMPEKFRKKLEGNGEALFLYRKLTTLNTQCCTEITLEHLKRKAFDFENLLTFFREFEMPSLVRELEELKRKNLITTEEINSPAINALGIKQSRQLSLFDIPEQAPTSTLKLIQDVLQLPSPQSEKVALIQSHYVVRHSQGFYLAYDNSEYLYTGEAAPFKSFISQFKELVCMDYKSLLQEYSPYIPLNTKQIVYDLALMSYLLDPEMRDYSWAKISNQNYHQTEKINPSLPASLALKISSIFQEKLKENNLLNLYHNIEFPLIPILASMESKGILLDTQAIFAFLAEVQDNLNTLTEEIYKLAGTTFNIRSAQQIGNILFNVLELPTAGKTKGGLSSTSQDSLEKLAGKHPIIDALLDFRKLEKLRSTYLEPLPKLLKEDKRLHTTFNQMATATGRLSSSNPNLQNIPIRGHMGSRMRSCFVAEENNLLISADYSQIELRVLAHYSKEPSLISSFTHNEDIHRRTAALLNNINPEEVTQSQRQNAKTINFGLLYGMGARKLAQDIKVSLKEAQNFISTYFERFPGIKAFYETVENQAKELGYVTTLAGRRRLLPDLYNTNTQAQALAERQAVNTLIQGSAADIIKLAMLKVFHNQDLQKLQAQLLLQVHDELIFSIPQDNAHNAGEIITQLMTHINPDHTQGFAVPLVVEWAAAKNWQLAH